MNVSGRTGCWRVASLTGRAGRASASVPHLVTATHPQLARQPLQLRFTFAPDGPGNGASQVLQVLQDFGAEPSHPFLRNLRRCGLKYLDAAYLTRISDAGLDNKSRLVSLDWLKILRYSSKSQHFHFF